MTEKSKPVEKCTEEKNPNAPGEKTVTETRDRGPLLDKQKEEKAYEESKTRPPRKQITGAFGKQDLSDVHRMEKGESFKSVVQERLGPQATEEQVQTYMMETALMSGFKNPSEIRTGNAIQFPPVASSDGVDNGIKPPVLDEVTQADALKELHDAFETLSKIAKSFQPKPFAESSHKMQPGETFTSIAAKKLGAKATPGDIEMYVRATELANKPGGKSSLTGQTVVLPGINQDGDAEWINRKDDSKNSLNQFDILSVRNRDGTSFTRTNNSEVGTHIEVHYGPRLEDQFKKESDDFTHRVTVTRTDHSGRTIEVSNDGTTVTNYPDSKVIHYADGSNVVEESTTGISTNYAADGSRTVTFLQPDAAIEYTNNEIAKGQLSEFYRDRQPKSIYYAPDGNVETKYFDGSLHIQNIKVDTDVERWPQGGGGYLEVGKGPRPEDNYSEKYSSKDGVTSRLDKIGTPDETTTLRSPDGTIQIYRRDHTSYQRNPDGTEEYKGFEPGDNHKEVPSKQHLEKARRMLESVIRAHIPLDAQAQFRKDLNSFETRLQSHGVSSDEAAKSYEQLTRLLTAPLSKAAVDMRDRQNCAVTLMHQMAFPEITDQGHHDTCNVTTVAERLLTREPSKAAEIATTMALTGGWVAADGKAIKIDKESLKPGREETKCPPEDGARSYATQLLNLAMVNDSTQRRVPPVFYEQGTPDVNFPKDTGERLLDSHGAVMNHPRRVGEVWTSRPYNSPELLHADIAELAHRLMGDEHFYLQFSGASTSIDNFASQQDLEDNLLRMKNQRTLPAIMAVNAWEVPFNTDINDNGPVGEHVVSITNYDPVHHRVKISNQWGRKSDMWVDAGILYQNALRA